ncbi:MULTISPECIES: hypothetical protein [unclassified Ruminococcus]|uniref:hypothetical protein n=1 Tax=unclassified Ruminococcus TaxID=2608920 RepID=UPI00210BC2F6|nr:MULTISPECIES: hypothetical protein [unclassified Ruminococcus]MCQ4021937.1 hypothetical protein [Ruminococcus sp. zg-924]MCQ4114473.1 hypothetical protein [Ruminococcus sp. zg-921]
MKIMSTDYAENYARQMLNRILEFDLFTLLHKDKPDLQDFDHQIGIEVTQDVYEREMQCLRFWVKYEKMPYDKIPKKEIELYYKNLGTLEISDNHIIHGTLGETKENNPTHLIDTINSKLKKLNSGHYTIFENNMLYVFVETVSLFDSYIISLIKEVNATNYPLKYTRIILDGWFELCDCDIVNQSYCRHNITSELRQEIRRSISTE